MDFCNLCSTLTDVYDVHAIIIFCPQKHDCSSSVPNLLVKVTASAYTN